MKAIAALFALVGIHGHAHETEDLSQSRLLDCIQMVENSRLGFVSSSGCRGVYQISKSVWETWSKEPHQLANDQSEMARAITRNVALKQIHWILNVALPSLHLPMTPYSFALLWKPGYGNVFRLHLTDANVDYARRFRNLYEDKSW